MAGRGTWLKVAAVVIVALIIIFPTIIVLAYNHIVTQDQTVQSQWAQVENQIQRKLDLIPSLIATAEGFADFERGLLENITALRSQFLAAGAIDQRINISQQLDQLLLTFRAVYENYPVPVTGQLFLGLMDELAGTENRIAVERLRYNDAVRSYNTAIRVFPNNLVAAMFGFQDHPFFDPIPGGV